MKSSKMAQSIQSVCREAQNLEVRYGEIGISAVVAAMRYQGDATAAAHISTDHQGGLWLKDMVCEFAA
ncbi:MAG TPA: hypothetical protein VG291_00380 [Xanthobacteraceae bacterium]|nr:hypothetical protein [Xanthobacteraceae bacterium]